MKKFLTSCIGVAVLFVAGLTASAQACQQCGVDFGCATGCGATRSLWFYGGHLEAGIYGNSHGQRNVYNPANRVPGESWMPQSGNTIALGPARMADLQMNQLYGSFGKKLDTRCGWDIGGQVDFMYGTDALFTQSRGLEYNVNANGNNDRWGEGDYLASFPQIFAELGYRKLSVKFGKFYTPLEEGAIASPNRFFYSTSYVHHLLPITQTGALATWDATSRLSVYGGWTCGEDVDFDDHTASTFANERNNAALFGFNYKVNRKIHFGYGVLMGQENDVAGVAGNKHDYFTQSFVIGIQPNRCWDYTFEWVLRNHNREAAGVANAMFAAYGINQELIYKLNRCWAFGLRGEWFQNAGTVVPAAVGGARRGPSANFYEVSLGTNWTPSKYLVVRPEIRYDICDTDYFKLGTQKEQFGFGVSTIVKF